MLSSGNLKKALLLIGDTATRMGSPYDKSRVPLFGDCGTALALEYHEDTEPIIVDFHTFGKGYRALMTPAGGFRHPVTPESFEYEDFGNGRYCQSSGTYTDQRYGCVVVCYFQTS